MCNIIRKKLVSLIVLFFFVTQLFSSFIMSAYANNLQTDGSSINEESLITNDSSSDFDMELGLGNATLESIEIQEEGTTSSTGDEQITEIREDEEAIVEVSEVDLTDTEAIITINSIDIVYPDVGDSIVATLDWLKLLLNITLPSMKMSETIQLSLGENGNEWDYSKQPFIVGNYKITTDNSSNFFIEALKDTNETNLDLNLALRYKEKINEVEKIVTLIPTLNYKNEIVSKNSSVKIKKYIDKPEETEIVKKVSAGITSEGNLAWIIYWNYNGYFLSGTQRYPFIFEEMPFEGQKIIKESILVYDVNQPIIDGERNVNHDDYNYDFSYFLQNHITEDTIYINEIGTTIFDGQNPENSYYIYLETSTSDVNPGDVFTNQVYMQTSGDGTGPAYGRSEAEIALPPNNGGDERLKVSVNKVWDDFNNQDKLRPSSIQVQLYANNKIYGKPVELNNENKWTTAWSNLRLRQQEEINYTVKEISDVDGYISSIDETDKKNVTITNTHMPEKIAISGTKIWDDTENKAGKRPDSITLNLLANGVQIDSKLVTAEMDWKYSFINLAKYESGIEIIYTVTENTVTDYTTTIEGTKITNHFKPGKTSVTVTKAWDDSDDQDGLRPVSIQVQLYANGVGYASPVTLNSENKWTTNWTDLKVKQDGKEVVYTVKEVGIVEGYEETVNDSDKGNVIITNSHILNTTENSTNKKSNKQSEYYTTRENKATTSHTQNKLPKTGEQNNRFNLVGNLLPILLAFSFFYLIKSNKKILD